MCFLLSGHCFIHSQANQTTTCEIFNLSVVSMDYSTFILCTLHAQGKLMKLAVTRKDLWINKEAAFLL